MDLFELLGKVKIDTSDADKALDKTAEKGQQAQGKLSKAFSAMGKGAAVAGKAIGVGLGIAATAVVGVTKKALDAVGSLEQNMGGSEAVFGQYADKMQAKAKEAYSKMGLATSDYLATANKMGSLFKGAGFEAGEAADITADAMQRAADVASIMGISTEAAMESIAGAAKGNFTMMDNLGVAMNDTTLNAYALEKGIGKTTQEMTNQEKIGLAMQMFMEKTADYAGNYSKENETLAGSLGTAKAAFQNFLDGSGDAEQLVNAFVGAINSIATSLTDIAPRLVQGFTEVINKLLPHVQPILQQLLPVVIEGAIGLVQGVVEVLPSIIDTLLDALPALIDGFVKIVNALVAALPEIIDSLLVALPTLIPLFVDAAISITNGVVAALPQILSSLIKNLPAIMKSIWESVKKIWANTDKFYANIFGKAFEAIKKAFSKVGSFFGDVWGSIKKSFSSVTDWFSNTFKKAWTAVKNVFSTGGKVFDGIKSGIANVFTTTVNAIIGGINKVISVPFNALNDVLAKIKNVEIAAIKPFTWVTTFDVPQIPLLEWNANAMNNPRIFDKPTIYGYNPSAGAYQGVGEAGSEVVSGTNTLMDMISAAVASQNAALIEVLSKILDAITGMDGNMGESLRDALNGVSLDINKREFARLVREI